MFFLCPTVPLSQIFGDVQFGCQSILVLHRLCPQMLGRWDSGTAGKHLTSVLLCPKYLGQWDGGTQEKHVQLGCQSILVHQKLDEKHVWIE